jgi:cyclase
MKNVITILALSALTACATPNKEVATDEKQPVWDGNTVVLSSEKLGEGVYAYYSTEAKQKEAQGFPVATSGGFIVGDDGVLMIDTMLNKRLNEQAQALVKSATKVPLSFAVNTSAHGDHSYGNMYLPGTTQIIQHANAKHYVENYFEHDTQFMISNFGEGAVSKRLCLPPVIF